VEAQRDTALLKLQRARSGFSSARSSINGEASSDVHPPNTGSERDAAGDRSDATQQGEDAEVDDVVKKYLRKIAKLEKEVKHLKQVRPP
jgi:hypothetical protein